MPELQGKVVIVTGGGQGMGEAHARRCVEEGASVLIGDVNAAAGEKLAAELGACARFVPLDVTSGAAWREAVDLAERLFGPVTVLINNAGITGPAAETSDLAEDDYRAICDINQTGTYLGMKHCIPSMLRAGYGSIVNISSISGIVSIYGTPNCAYAASKFAVRGLTKFVAIEYAARNIRVNSIHPGYIRTPMMTATLDDEQIGIASGSVPMKRVGEPVEVADLAVFLASDRSRFITGSEHVIDGGLVSQ